MGFVNDAAQDVAGGIEDICYYLFGPPQVQSYLWDDPKFLLGLLLWGSVWRYWLWAETENRYKVVGEFHWTAIQVFGMNLVTLSTLQQLGPVGFFGLGAMSYANITMTRKLFPAEREREAESFEASTIYEDLSCPMRQVVTIFVGQTALTIMLIYSVYCNYQTKQDSITYTFWLAAYISVQMSGLFKRSGDSQLGRTWDLERWRAVESRNMEVMYQKGQDKWYFTKSSEEMKWRGRMGFIVNTFYRDVVAFITPVLCLESSSGVDFSQNCFAVSYITQLDDMKNAKEFKVAPRAPAGNDVREL